MLTHIVREKQIDAAIAKIEALPVVRDKIIRLRVEELS
jgi:homoserine dehydrogenase